MGGAQTDSDDGPGETTDADKDESEPGVKELRTAARKLDKAVRSAFEDGRTPTPEDVSAIATTLQNVADSVIAGRQTCLAAAVETQASDRNPAGVTERHATSAQGPLYITNSRHEGRRAGMRRGRNRRRGSGVSRRHSAAFSVFFGNVTSMSEKAEQFLLSVPDAMWLAAETHIRQHETMERCRAWKQRWDITASPAAQSPESERGSYGGVMAATRRHLHATSICMDTAQDGWDLSTE